MSVSEEKEEFAVVAELKFDEPDLVIAYFQSESTYENWKNGTLDPDLSIVLGPVGEGNHQMFLFDNLDSKRTWISVNLRECLHLEPPKNKTI